MLKPREYQLNCINKFKAENSAALFMRPGLGKTLTAVNLYREYCKREGGALRIIIFCPIIVMQGWKKHFASCSKVPPKLVNIIDGKTSKKRVEQIGGLVTIINYEAIRNEEVLKKLYEFSADVIVCDESHKIKTHTSKVFKEIFKLSRKIKYRMILTGTPTPKDESDLFAQFLFLDATFGTSHRSFMNEYFINLNAGWSGEGAFPQWVFNKNKRKQLENILAKKAFFLSAEGNIELPDYQEIEIDVPMSLEQTKHYQEIKEKLITWIDGEEENPLVVQHALTKILRLNEVSSGYLKLEDGKIKRLKKNPKLDACLELLETLLPNKVLIFCIFKEDYAIIKEALEKKKITYVEIHGATKDKFAAVEKLKEVDVAICNPRSAGLGVDELKIAPYSIYFSRSFSYDEYEQSKARNFRSGSSDLHEKVVHYHLLTAGVDKNIFAKLKNKDKLASTLFEIKGLL